MTALAWLAWNCIFNPAIPFLTPGSGKWIVYPLPPTVPPYPGFDLIGTFTRTFVLTEKPAVAPLSWRCLNKGELRVNGMAVPRSIATSDNWKTASEVDVAPFLRQGSNEVSVVVTNHLGPPALSLALKVENVALNSDETWNVSVCGSTWRAAQAASATPVAGKGNELYPLETTGGALGRCWPWLLLFFGVSVCAVVLAHYSPAFRFSPAFLLVAAAVIWASLFIHNFSCLPPAAGFDASHHLAYVKYIQERQRLPDAREGWEMFQPPLYYLISAAALNWAHCKVFEFSGMVLLRYLGLAIGLVNLALIFAGLRIVFPGGWRKPLIGLGLAAFLPVEIYLLHYPTNETLSAMFVTAALCLGLHLLRSERPWRGWYYLLGVALGLALMSKASALLAVAAISGVLALNLALRRERNATVWLQAIVAPLFIGAAIGGWHYVKLWRAFGNPFIGNWDPKVAAAWWQLKGVNTPGYFFSFGRSLSHPFFSGFHSFWDGLYSTVWGDGLMGGKDNVWTRPPWNYDLMAVGFVLALIPAALVLTGLVRAIALCFRKATPAWLLLVGFGWLFAFAILYMTAKIPSYAQAKAFYAMPLLLPFCAVGVLGYEYWAGRGAWLRRALGVGLGMWLLNVYASYWIRPDTGPAELSFAMAKSLYLNADPSTACRDVLERHPDDADAIVWLATTPAGRKNPGRSLGQLEEALKANPGNEFVEAYLAWYLAQLNRLDEALVHARRAVAAGPEDKTACKLWSDLAWRRGNYEEAAEAARALLSSDPTDLNGHSNLERALINLDQTAVTSRGVR